MKKQLFYTLILQVCSLHTVLLETDAQKHGNNYLNLEAQKIVNVYCKNNIMDIAHATSVCDFLNKRSALATFPANTVVTVGNRQYVQTEDMLRNNWCVLFPEREPNAKLECNTQGLKLKISLMLQTSTTRFKYARSSKRPRDD